MATPYSGTITHVKSQLEASDAGPAPGRTGKPPQPKAKEASKSIKSRATSRLCFKLDLTVDGRGSPRSGSIGDFVTLQYLCSVCVPQASLSLTTTSTRAMAFHAACERKRAFAMADHLTYHADCTIRTCFRDGLRLSTAPFSIACSSLPFERCSLANYSTSTILYIEIPWNVS